MKCKCVFYDDFADVVLDFKIFKTRVQWVLKSSTISAKMC